MSFRGWNEKAVGPPRGAWTRLDKIQVRPERAFAARNVRFEPEGCVSRPGLVSAFAAGGKVTSMHQWITSSLNRLIFYEGSKVRIKDLTSVSAASDLYTLAGRGASVAEAGDKAYIAVYTNAGIGAGQARFYNPTILGTPSDKAFAPPGTVSPTVTDAGAGLCTAGDHRFGYILESRSGYAGKPGPAPGDSFSPVTFTVLPDSTVNMAFTLSVTAAPVVVHPIMTRADNPNKWFFVPDQEYSILVDGSIPVSINISISDGDLANRALSADDHFNYLSQSVSGTGPFNPSKVVSYGQRLCYLVDNKWYISEPNDFETLTEDLHTVYLPGRRQIITGFPQGGNFYSVGPGWTYVSTDNEREPRTWPAPQEVSSSIGTSAPDGVAWRTGGDSAWVASEKGLYLFEGRYHDTPISELNSDFWKRINWAASYSLHIMEDTKRHLVYVAAPLDSETEPTRLLVWDWTRGRDWDVVDFCYDDFAFGAFSSIASVQDATTGKTSVYIGPASAGNVRKQDETATNDAGSAIAASWQSGAVIGKKDGGLRLKTCGGLEIDVKGSGNMDVTVYSQDRLDSITNPPGPITLQANPGEYVIEPVDFNSQNFSVEFGVDALDEHFDLGGFTLYHRPYMSNK